MGRDVAEQVQRMGGESELRPRVFDPAAAQAPCLVEPAEQETGSTQTLVVPSEIARSPRRLTRLLGQPDSLGFVLARGSESAELGEAYHQARAIPHRRGCTHSEILVHAVGRQCREVVGSKLNYLLVLTPTVTRLFKVASDE